MEPLRPTVLEVDLDCIAHNTRLLSSLVSPARLMAVVKADGYGHGAVPVAKTALAQGAGALGVALVEEGMALREAGIQAPILVLGAASTAGMWEAVRHDLAVTVFTPEQVRFLHEAARRQGKRAKAHLKLDTGMNRIGLRTPEEARAVFAALSGGAVTLEGVFTHLATADMPEERAFVYAQRAAFEALLEVVRGLGFQGVVHAAASAAAISYPDLRYDMVRTGIGLYGGDASGKLGLRPALTWRTQVAQVKTIAPGETVSYGRRFRAERPTRIATLPVGYADGYLRCFSNKAQVLLRGCRAPVVGSVCMDQCMVDVTELPGVSVGEEAVLLGKQGEERLLDSELAGWADTISYEVMTSISNRVPRLYRP